MPVETLQHAIQRVQNLRSYAGYKDRETHTFGVVLECSLPRATRGTDSVVNINIVDESMCSNGNLESVELMVFSRTVDNMPKAMPGDIIELRHVVVQFWEAPSGGAKKPQLFGKMSKPHPFGYLLYHRTAPPGGGDAAAAAAAAAVQPYQVYNTASIGGQHTAEKLVQLRSFAAQIMQPGSHVSEPDTSYLRRIKDLDVPQDPHDRPVCVDMRVQVLAIDKRRPEEEIVLYVWDATDVKPLPADHVMLPSQWKGVELTITRPKRHMMPLTPQPPALQVLQALPPLGTAIPVIMEPAVVPRAGLPAVGDWVKLKVVGLAAVQGQMQVVFGSSSRLTMSQPHAGFNDWYNTRLANNDTSEWPSDEANIATRCSRQDLQHVTLRQVQLKAAAGQLGPFRVQARLTGYLPRELQHWCKPMTRQQQQQQRDGASGSSQPQQQWQWAANVLLEDATDALRAVLMGDAATRLLGLPPHDLTTHPDDVQQLQHRLDELSAVDENGGIWMDMALTAVYTQQQQQQQAQQQQAQQQEDQQQHQDQEAQLQQGEQQEQQQRQGQEQQRQGEEQQQQQMQGSQQQQGAERQQQQQQDGSQQASQGQQPEGHDQQAAVRQDGQQNLAPAAQPAGSPGQAAGSNSAGGRGASAAAGPARPCFILHDAVCPYMHEQEHQRQQQPQQEQQQQQQGQQLQQQHRARCISADLSEEPTSKRQRHEQQQQQQGGVPAAADTTVGADTTGGAAAAGAAVQQSQPATQELTPGSRAVRDHQQAFVFM